MFVIRGNDYKFLLEDESAEVTYSSRDEAETMLQQLQCVVGYDDLKIIELPLPKK